MRTGTDIEVIFSLGSNCGDRIGNVRKALDWLEASFPDFKASSIYETPEIHGIGSPYMNAVGVCRCSLMYETMHELTKQYEKKCGRDSRCREMGEVPIDIDIVVWDGEILRTKDYSSNFFRIGYDMLK